MRIAVTGACGKIGSRLCSDLARDHDVTRIDVRGDCTIVDVAEFEALKNSIEGSDTLIHLAWGGGASRTATWPETQKNIAGTYNAFEAARLVGCKRVIFASSNHAVGMYEMRGAPGIYEPHNGTLLRVDVPFRPDGLYGVWKAFGEVLGRYYSDEYGLQVACLRIGHITEEDRRDLDRMTFTPRESATGVLSEDQMRKRESSVYMSHRDFAGLVRAILASDVPYGVVYGVSNNSNRFFDTEESRTLYGFTATDGIALFH